jgi:hypothetical protein
VLSAEATAADHPAHAYFIDRYSRIVRELEAAYADARDAGDLRPGIEPARAARDLVALMDGLQIQWLLGDPALDMAAAVDAHLRAQLTGPPERLAGPTERLTGPSERLTGPSERLTGPSER